MQDSQLSTGVKLSSGMLGVHLEEYAMLCNEIRSRSAQQQTLITSSWLIVLGGGVAAFVAVAQRASVAVMGAYILWLLLIPISLSVLAGTFIRHDHKVLTILAYLYGYLKPNIMRSLRDLEGNGQSTEEIECRTLTWPNREWSISKENRLLACFRPISEVCRYGIMLIPPVMMLLLIYVLYADQIETTGLIWLFFVDILAVVVMTIGYIFTVIAFWDFHHGSRKSKIAEV